MSINGPYSVSGSMSPLVTGKQHFVKLEEKNESTGKQAMKAAKNKRLTTEP